MRRHLANIVAALLITGVGGSLGAILVLLAQQSGRAEVWVPTIGALLGAVAAPYVAEWLRTHYFTADLVVHCEPREPWAVSTEVGYGTHEALKANPLARGIACYRISIKNVGVSRALNVEAALEHIWFLKRQQWYRLAFWEPATLPWSGDLSQSRDRDVNRGRILYVDVGSVPTEEVLSLKPRTKRWPSQKAGLPRFCLSSLTEYFSQPYELEPGSYVLQIGVYASNATAQEVFLDLEFKPGDFNEIQFGIFKGAVSGVKLDRREMKPTHFIDVPTYMALTEITRPSSEDVEFDDT